MSKKNPELKDTIDETRLYVKWIFSSVLDGIFVALWVFVQWGVDKIIANFPILEIDLWVLWSFRIIFAFTTLAPIIIYIYEDVMVMIYRAVRRVRKERSS